MRNTLLGFRGCSSDVLFQTLFSHKSFVVAGSPYGEAVRGAEQNKSDLKSRIFSYLLIRQIRPFLSELLDQTNTTKIVRFWRGPIPEGLLMRIVKWVQSFNISNMTIWTFFVLFRGPWSTTTPPIQYPLYRGGTVHEHIRYPLIINPPIFPPIIFT